jgi:hypothetical protein
LLFGGLGFQHFGFHLVFDHHYAASVPADYFEFADSVGLDPWRTRTSGVFAGAVIALRRGPRGLPASLRPHDGFVVRRLARHRPFRPEADSPAERAGL